MNIAQGIVRGSLQSLEAVCKAVCHLVWQPAAVSKAATHEGQIICHTQNLLPAKQSKFESLFSLLDWITGGGRSGGGADKEIAKEKTVVEAKPHHPDDFHVCGPRNVSRPNWRDLIRSSWKNDKYKRSVIACFTHAMYLLEMDRQEKREAASAVAPKWWERFKYKLTKTLVDERDGSIFGAILEWDQSAAFGDFVVMRPSGASRAVLALRGTLLRFPTIRRDIEDDLRYVAWESLKGSVRFGVILKALKSVAEKYGSDNVCIAGHSLGAGFALQVGKALARQGMYVETHLFNPPSVSIAPTLRDIRETAGFVWNRFMSMLHLRNDQSVVEVKQSEVVVGDTERSTIDFGLKKWIPSFSGLMNRSGGLRKWLPHLYVNKSDYICCYYADLDEGIEGNNAGEKKNVCRITNGQVAAKLFVMPKRNQRFLEAHSLEQWWSEDLELQMALRNSKLISRQLRSLYSVPGPQLALAR
ncbi:PREDICTED: GDSL esterase/lipase At4g10955-like [Fragaria vesca subsp. vesca]|uniref:GDSL esterase/lipase At4g10955-like n=1 Tax=Fragaria vesca subsp. vesca TaxID=101020 RepID=UPI0002C2DF07|nr:PREDICTED: GDSL esterase/lipase At4g10955-like [Fragaria vesca subsp. vesca]